jgi:hypothetical protein
MKLIKIYNLKSYKLIFNLPTNGKITIKKKSSVELRALSYADAKILNPSAVKGTIRVVTADKALYKALKPYLKLELVESTKDLASIEASINLEMV